MYLLEAPDETIPSFKEVWAGVGDSIVVVGGDGLWNCHIHTDDIGAAIEASIDAGRPRNIRVTDLLEQVEEERWVREAALTAGSGPAERRPGPAPATGVVAVASGDGIARIFRSLGVEGLIAGGQTMNPSVAELVDAVDALGSDEAVLLPNNGNIRPVADRVDELAHKPVWVIPTESVAEGFAALLAYDPGADGASNAAAMEASARRVVAGEVTRAVRDADSAAGPDRPRATGSGSPARGSRRWTSSLGEAGLRAARGAGDRGARAGHHHRGRGVGAGRRPDASPSGCGRNGLRSRPRCTTAASPSTRTSSPSSDEPLVPGGRRVGASGSWPRWRCPSSPGSGTRQPRSSAELGIETVLDLVRHYPRRYIDGTRLAPIAELARGGPGLRPRRGHAGVPAAGPPPGSGTTSAVPCRARSRRRERPAVGGVLQPDWRASQLPVGTVGPALRHGRIVQGRAPDGEPGGRRAANGGRP